jgi:hypothetical protein
MLAARGARWRVSVDRHGGASTGLADRAQLHARTSREVT